MNSEESKQFYKEIRERMYELKIAHLFEEPCPLYEPEWDDNLWDCRLTYDYEEDQQ